MDIFKKWLSSVPLLKNLNGQLIFQKEKLEFSGLNTEEVFTKIYTNKRWGVSSENPDSFSSGFGSHGISADQYVLFLNDFIQRHCIKVITDIGCGDFAIGSKIVRANPFLHYNGCDVVKDVIDLNLKQYGSPFVKFYHKNCSTDVLPEADLLTIRQVLQHLSNNEIAKILAKAEKYKYVIITEHLLKEGTEKSYNKDKHPGPHIRLIQDSGVYINKPPFSLSCTEVLRCREDIYNKEAYIVTFLISNV